LHVILMTIIRSVKIEFGPAVMPAFFETGQVRTS